MVSKVSYKYLLANFVQNVVWLAYSIKVDNIDLIVINFLSVVITSIFLALYIYAKIKVGHHQRSFLLLLLSIPLMLAAFSEKMPTEQTGLLATLLNIFAYAISLDNISIVLKTRDKSAVDMGLTVACVVNGIIWLVYAILVRDIFVLIPNLAALVSAAV
jgi:solute carrier family 50 protein (sugar transporter)